MSSRHDIARARRVVVKLGTAVLTGGGPSIDRAYLHDVASIVSGLIDDGREVILVSSGAIAAGVEVLSMSSRPTDVSEQQAAAAAGQPMLMTLWREAFDVRRRPAAQVLVSRADFDSRERYLNIRNCISCLIDMGAAAVVNENDTVATEEISLGDNDVLAAKLAVALGADALVILTTVDGVMNESGDVVAEARTSTELVGLIRRHKSSQGRGGMQTKVEAARIASLSGIPTVIANGRPASALKRVLAGESVGTCVHQGSPRHAGRRLWISTTATPAGVVDIDAGAADALMRRGASLLARGVTGVTGRFDVGDVLLIRDHQGREVARGLTNLTADELRRVMGRPSAEFASLLGRQAHEEVVHRDNLAVMPGSGRPD